MPSRHAKPDRCPMCNAAKFRVEIGLTKPNFKCLNDCYSWSSGRDGGEYLKHAVNYDGGDPREWVEIIIE